MGEKMAVIQEIEVLKKALMEHDRTAMEGAIKGCIDAGIDAEDVVCAIQEQMCVVGTMFEKGRLFLPQMIAIAGCIEASMGILSPILASRGESEEDEGLVIIGTVEGDVHDIGKNICAILIASSGFRVKDLGRDVLERRFVEEVRRGASYCGMSSLITSTMLVMKDVIDDLVSENLRDGAVVMVGGAPVTQAFADKIGADIYGETAFQTVARMKGMDSDKVF